YRRAGSRGRSPHRKSNLYHDLYFLILFHSAFDIMDGERSSVLFRLGRIENHSIEERLSFFAWPAVGVADFLHRFFVNVRAHDFPGDAFVIDGSAEQTPPAILREEPDGILVLRVI